MGTIWEYAKRIVRGVGHLLTVKEAVANIILYWGSIFGWAALAGGFVMGLLFDYKLLGALSIGLILSALVALWRWFSTSKATPQAQTATQTEPTALATSAPLPNWTFRELFFFVRPDVLEGNPNNSVWEDVGQEVRDAMALGRLKCWGRPMRKELIATLVEDNTKAVPECIKRSYWRDADLTYNFLDEQAQFREHTYPNHGSGLPTFCDLQVNRQQAESLAWHQKVHVPLREAATRAYEQTRGSLFAGVAEGEGKPFLVLRYYCFAFIDKLVFYGCRAPSRVSDAISRNMVAGCDFIEDGGEIVLVDRGSSARFENVSVLAVDLSRVIDQLWRIGKEK